MILKCCTVCGQNSILKYDYGSCIKWFYMDLATTTPSVHNRAVAKARAKTIKCIEVAVTSIAA